MLTAVCSLNESKRWRIRRQTCKSKNRFSKSDCAELLDTTNKIFQMFSHYIHSDVQTCKVLNLCSLFSLSYKLQLQIIHNTFNARSHSEIQKAAFSCRMCCICIQIVHRCCRISVLYCFFLTSAFKDSWPSVTSLLRLFFLSHLLSSISAFSNLAH